MVGGACGIRCLAGVLTGDRSLAGSGRDGFHVQPGWRLHVLTTVQQFFEDVDGQEVTPV